MPSLEQWKNAPARNWIELDEHGRPKRKRALKSVVASGSLIVKDEDRQRYTLGVVYAKNELDSEKDFATEDDLEKAAWEYLANTRDIGVMHKDGTSGAGVLVESYIYRGPRWEVEGQVVEPGDWVAGAIWEEPTFKRILNGDLTGWSLQGEADMPEGEEGTAASLVAHLPGQHDQENHAGGGGGGSKDSRVFDVAGKDGRATLPEAKAQVAHAIEALRADGIKLWHESDIPSAGYSGMKTQNRLIDENQQGGQEWAVKNLGDGRAEMGITVQGKEHGLYHPDGPTVDNPNGAELRLNEQAVAKFGDRIAGVLRDSGMAVEGVRKQSWDGGWGTKDVSYLVSYKMGVGKTASAAQGIERRIADLEAEHLRSDMHSLVAHLPGQHDQQDHAGGGEGQRTMEEEVRDKYGPTKAGEFDRLVLAGVDPKEAKDHIAREVEAEFKSATDAVDRHLAGQGRFGDAGLIVKVVDDLGERNNTLGESLAKLGLSRDDYEKLAEAAERSAFGPKFDAEGRELPKGGITIESNDAAEERRREREDRGFYSSAGEGATVSSIEKRIAELEAAGLREEAAALVAHLPGQHDQADHAGGGGGSDAAPKWSESQKAAGGNEGHAYVIHGTREGISEGKSPQQAFVDSAEDQNFYGDRPDIVREREQIAEKLEANFGIKVDPNSEGIMQSDSAADVAGPGYVMPHLRP